jgi:hypothetical protein
MIRKVSFSGKDSTPAKLSRVGWGVFLLGVFLLVVIKAVIAEFDSGPNESDHFPVARYYQQYTLPPAAGQKEALPSYSRYGYSYIDSLNMAYPIAGKWLGVLEEIRIPTYFAIRSFNILMLGILLMTLFRAYPSVSVLLLLFCIPDLWYHFSYFNGDAFSVTVSVLTLMSLYQLSVKIRLSRPLVQMKWNLIWCGVCGGLMVVSKINFMLVAGFLALWSVVQWWGMSPELREKWLKVCLIAGGIGCMVAGPRIAWDVHVNGWNKQERVEEVRRAMAAPAYMPENLGKPGAWTGLNLSDHSVSLKQVVWDNNWLWLTLRKGAGMFGYHQWYYVNGLNQLLAIAIVGFICLYFRKLLQSCQCARHYTTVFLSIGFVLLNLALSLYHSMTLDFQPEFRYLLPAVCILLIPGLELRIQWVGWEKGWLLGVLILSLISYLVAALISMPRSDTYEIKRDKRYFDYPLKSLSESEEVFLERRGLAKPIQ